MSRSSLSKRITPDFIQELKSNASAFNSFIHDNNNGGSIIYLLEKLGRLEGLETKDSLISLLKSNKDKVRALAIKNLAKMSDISLLVVFFKYANEDSSTDVRRESVAAIGRLHNEDAVPYLIKCLSDEDPKIVLQAIRGLLPFSGKNKIDKSLLSIKDHPNEIVREVINNKFNKKEEVNHNKATKSINYERLRNKVVLGKVEDILKYIPNESIDLTFTSPPYYNARDYSIYSSYEEYLKCLAKIFKGVLRATKEGRFFIINTSPIIVPRMSRAHSSKRYPIPYDIHPLLVKMGWEFIDDIVWVKPEACVKNRNAGFFQHRKPLGYKPNAITEMLMVYRKKTDKLLDWNMKQYDSRTINKSKIRGDYETTNVWKISPTFNKTHSAVFPEEICNRVINFYSYAGDLIFDPFGGSGTLGRTASNLNRNFLLAEKEVKYFEYMKKTWYEKSSFFKNSNEVEFLKIKDFITSNRGK